MDVITERIEIETDTFLVPREKWLCHMDADDDVTVWIGSEEQVPGRDREARKELAAGMAERFRGGMGCWSAWRPDHPEDWAELEGTCRHCDNPTNTGNPPKRWKGKEYCTTCFTFMAEEDERQQNEP